MREINRRKGRKIGGKRSLETMTEERSAHAKKAFLAAAWKRTAHRLAREASIKRGKKTTR
jgi:hypothetical protein